MKLEFPGTYWKKRLWSLFFFSFKSQADDKAEEYLPNRPEPWQKVVFSRLNPKAFKVHGQKIHLHHPPESSAPEELLGDILDMWKGRNRQTKVYLCWLFFPHLCWFRDLVCWVVTAPWGCNWSDMRKWKVREHKASWLLQKMPYGTRTSAWMKLSHLQNTDHNEGYWGHSR